MRKRRATDAASERRHGRALRATFAGALVAFAALVGAAPRAGALDLQSRYSSLQNCAGVDRLKLADRTLEKGPTGGIFHCPGEGGYSVYVAEDDPRSFIVLERGKKLFSLQKALIDDFTLGYFPNVSGASKAEWRVDPAGKVVGLILRVAYQRRDAPPAKAAASTLYVFDLRDKPALIGSAERNEEARALLDGAVGAGPAMAAEEKLSRACNAIYVELCKGVKPGPEMLGQCFDKRPAVADRVPKKCVADFQTNIENYHDAMGAR